MPSVKDFKNKQNKQNEKTETDTVRAKRRPGREEPESSNADVKVVDVETGVHPEANSSTDLHEAHTLHEKIDHRQSGKPAAGSGSSSAKSDSHKSLGDFEAAAEGPKVEIKFFGSELLRSKLPKPFDVAEAVATDWVNNGNFEKLPIDHPLGHFALQKGLLKAKELEKKVMESPVTEKVAMQVLTVGMKAQSLFEQVRSKIKK
ncbi:MAG: hypothetical protein ACK5P7_05240 [Bdellovibrio sp.]